MKDRRPAAWNQWAEVVGRDMRAPRFVGDMPHGWISSDYIRSVLDLFAYERESDQSLVVADGVPVAWLAGEGVGVQGLRTPYGPLAYSMKARKARYGWRSQLALPSLRAASYCAHRTTPGLPGRTTINGKQASWTRGELRVTKLPAAIAITPHLINKATP